SIIYNIIFVFKFILMTVEDAKAIIEDAIDNNTTHPNYKRVNELSVLYRSLITGDGVEGLLRQFQQREDEQAFQQRIDLMVSTTDALCSSIMNPFEKVLRTDPLVKRIESKDEKAIDILTDKLMDFYSSENQNSGLDYWLQTRFKALSFIDPNAFLVLEWDGFDNNRERASPYPYEVSCQQAVLFAYNNSKLQYLIDKKPIEYMEGDVKKKGFKYTLYGIGFVIAYERVAENYIEEPN